MGGVMAVPNPTTADLALDLEYLIENPDDWANNEEIPVALIRRCHAAERERDELEQGLIKTERYANEKYKAGRRAGVEEGAAMLEKQGSYITAGEVRSPIEDPGERHRA